MVELDADMDQQEPPPADRRNEMAADMVPRRGEQQAVHEEALAMTKQALEEAARRVTDDRTLHTIRNLACRRLNRQDEETEGSDEHSTSGSRGTAECSAGATTASSGP